MVSTPKAKSRRDSLERRKSATTNTTTTTDDSESGSRKSSMSSGQKQQQQKQFAVTFFVSENDKTKLVDIIHRAKTVIAKKVDKVMGRKGADKAAGGGSGGQGAPHSAAGSRRSSGQAGHAGKEPTSALAITTILENWVSQEEEKGREEEVEVAELIEDQKAQGRYSGSFDEMSVVLDSAA